MAAVEYGVDLVTFYRPAFWGVSTHAEMARLARTDPEGVWERIFAALAEAGVTALEMTFPPADAASAVAAFGSPEGFRRELQGRGLRLKSVFHLAAGWGPGADRGAELAAALEAARFVAAAGGDTLVVGLPARRSRDAEPPLFVDLALAGPVADIAHIVGDATLRVGVRTALHTEAHSIFCTRRDIDLLLTLTDPEYVFFCPDTAHITLAGGDPVAAVAPHRERVVLAHWKDAVGAMPAGLPIVPEMYREHEAFTCPIGEGVVDWDAWIDLYATTPGAGVRMLELDAADDPVGVLKRARSAVERKAQGRAHA